MRERIGAINDRFREVREATGLKQGDFSRALNQVAKELLADDAPRYTQTRISDIERGAREITLDDVAVYAAVDPRQRGILWLGWNQTDASRAADAAAEQADLRARINPSEKTLMSDEELRRDRDVTEGKRLAKETATKKPTTKKPARGTKSA